jgi:hypothetical protein
MSPLRVALVVERTPVPAWIGAVARRLTDPAFEVQLYLDAPRAETRPRTYRAYEWIDRRVFGAAGDALAPVPVLDPRPLARLEDVDVVVRLGSTSTLADSARFGVWTLSHAELFWEMYRGTTYRTTLEANLPGGERRVLYDSRGRPDRTSLHRSRNQAYWKASGAIVRALQQLRERGAAYLDSRPRQHERLRSPEAPGPATVVHHAARVSYGVVARRVERIVRREEWFVAARPLGGSDGFRRFEAIAQEDFADPFAIDHDGETYVFFERLDHRVGRASIACTRVDAAGSPLEPVHTVLAPQYHVSYPFVFRRGDDVYMIPESLENATVDLYRATAFPSQWELEARLLSGVRAVDATLHDDGSQLWLFLNVAEPGASVNDELHVYTSSALDGPWSPHRENPVVSDVARARPAGRIFRRDGMLIRPSQDCSSGYGRAIVLNSIDVLTPTEYRETPIARIEPDWAPGLVGTHTYNATERVEVLDGFRRARRR